LPESKSEELLYAKRLRYEGKLMESFDIVKKLEEKGGLTDQEQLSIHILKGRVYAVTHQYEDTVKEGEYAYRLSQSLGKLSESITALLLQSHIVFLGHFDEALDFALKGEDLLNSLESESSSDLSGKKATLLHMKTWIYYFKGDYNLALEQAQYCLVLREKMGGKLNIAYTLLIIGYIYNQIGELNIALEHGMKCLWLFEELDNQDGITQCLSLNGRIYYSMGDLDQAIKMF
jgi:tetratricopeptide (TPR) repeat protein